MVGFNPLNTRVLSSSQDLPTMSEQLFWLSALPHRKELSGFSDITLENKTMLCPDLSYKRIVDIVDYLDSALIVSLEWTKARVISKFIEC